MSYEFEWDATKATDNQRKHGVSFHEACTVFADPLAMLMPDPDHSRHEGRYLVLGASVAGRLLVVSHTERLPRTRLISARPTTHHERTQMKKAPENPRDDRDTMRPEYDFSGAVRGATARRYAEGANVVVVSPDLLDVFPNADTVNEALHALAPMLRRANRPR